jgi:hypothetical protein
MKHIVLLFAIVPAIYGGSITIDFEGLADGTPVGPFYSGLAFQNATVLTAGVSLNEFEWVSSWLCTVSVVWALPTAVPRPSALHNLVRFARSQHSYELVRRAEPASTQRRRSQSTYCFQLVSRIGAKIDFGGLHAAMAEPQSNLPDIVRALKHQHRTAMTPMSSTT